MDFVFIEFIMKWIREGRFPREELRIRWWIATLGGLAILIVVVGLLASRSS